MKVFFGFCSALGVDVHDVCRVSNAVETPAKPIASPRSAIAVHKDGFDARFARPGSELVEQRFQRRNQGPPLTHRPGRSGRFILYGAFFDAVSLIVRHCSEPVSWPRHAPLEAFPALRPIRGGLPSRTIVPPRALRDGEHWGEPTVRLRCGRLRHSCDTIRGEWTSDDISEPNPFGNSDYLFVKIDPVSGLDCANWPVADSPLLGVSHVRTDVYGLNAP